MREAVREPFIGRERELAELLAGFEAASASRGGLYLVVGEPGIGKTALADRLAEQAAQQGARVVWSRAWEGGGATAYWTWIQIVRALAAGWDSETLASLLPADVAAPLARLVPELAVTPEAPATAPVPPPVPGEGTDGAAFRLFEATARFLTGVAARQPLVLVLDDVFAGDAPSLSLLRFLVRDLRATRLLLLATHRSAADGPSGSEDLLADLVREGRLLRLRGLDRDQVGRLVAAIAGTEPGPGKVATIHEATEGNPLFVREVTRLVAGQESLAGPGRLAVPVPDSVRAVIRRRLAGLSADSVAVLSAAAVVGRDFDAALASAAADLDPERVLGSVSEALALGVVREVADAVGRYRFTHPLMREVIYEALPLPARTQMHRRVGEAIERRPGPYLAPHLAELAHHFAQVASIGDGERAERYARLAGDAAMASYAYRDAIAQYRRALAAVRLAGLPECNRGELLLRLGDAYTRAGDYRPAEDAFLDAATIARRQQCPQRLARAALGLGVRQVAGGRVDQRLVDLLRAALAGLDRQDTPLRARVLARLSLELTFAGEVPDPAGREQLSRETLSREQLSREAVAMARRLGDVAAQASAYRARWMAVWGPDGLPERTELAAELVALGRRHGDREWELAGLARQATCALESGDAGAADVAVAAHARLAAELRMPYGEWAAATMRAGRALREGSFEAAERLATEASAVLPDEPNTRFAYLDQVGLIRWEQGRLAEVAGGYRQAAEEFPTSGFDRGRAAFAESYEDGYESAARRRLRSLLEEPTDPLGDGLLLPALALAALAAVRLDDGEAAGGLYRRLAPYAERVVVVSMPHPVLCLGSAALYLGLLAAVCSRWDDAAAHFEAAAQANDRAAAGWLARTRYEHARMLVRRGRSADRQRARALLDRAERAAAAAGMRAVSQGCARQRELVAGTPVAEAQLRSVFRREGDYWTVGFEGSVVRLRDAKGLRHLGRLLAEPGREFHVVDLATTPPAGGSAGSSPAGSGGRAGADGLVARSDLGDAGELLDARAKSEYKRRIRELRAELDDARSCHDPARAEKVERELEFLTRELARAVGMGGRDRRAASHAERARLNVTRAIRAAMANLARVHPALGRHLEVTIRTGRYCSYTPDPRAAITWHTSQVPSI